MRASALKKGAMPKEPMVGIRARIKRVFKYLKANMTQLGETLKLSIFAGAYVGGNITFVYL
jgi:hypothetical protein